MTSQNDESRVAFEHWATHPECGGFMLSIEPLDEMFQEKTGSTTDQYYKDRATQIAWNAWQASESRTKAKYAELAEAVSNLNPIADIEWHGKWRVKAVIEALSRIQKGGA
jgi:hypothetical protein